MLCYEVRLEVRFCTTRYDSKYDSVLRGTMLLGAEKSLGILKRTQPPCHEIRASSGVWKSVYKEANIVMIIAAETHPEHAWAHTHHMQPQKHLILQVARRLRRAFALLWKIYMKNG